MSPPESEASTLQERISTFLWVTCIAVCAAAICFQAWAERSSMNEDGMSYLDMAISAASGHYSSLVNLYWSPLYPALIAGAFTAFAPAASEEFPLVHLLNAGIGLLALGTFSFFFRTWISKHERLTGFAARQPLFLVFGYALFLWSTIQTTGVGTVSPDLLVNAFVFLAAGLVCRMNAAPGLRTLWREAVALGLALGLATWTKAALLPIGAVLVILLLITQSDPFRRRLWLTAGIVSLVSLTPLIVLMSQKAHRLTFGESGRINYAWEVQKEIPLNFGWTESAPATGTPVHPPRVVSERPKGYEYANMTEGTFPPWYDPSYFHEGLRIRILPGNQWRSFWPYVNELRWGHGRSFLPLVLGLVFLCWRVNWKEASQAVWRQSWMLLWPAVAFFAYALVFMQARYVAAFLVLFWLVLYDAAQAGLAGRWERTALLAVTAAVTIFSGAAAASQVKAASDFPDLKVAAKLTDLGLHGGDSIALIGPGYNAYFAHLARLKIVAHIEDPDQFWALPADDARMLLAKLQASGAKAVVSLKGCPERTPADWTYLGAPGYCAYLAQ